MHELPGEQLEDKDIARYEGDNASLFADIENRVKEQLQSQEPLDRRDAIDVIPLLSEEKRGKYVAKVLADQSMRVAELALKQIPFVSTAEQKTLFDALSQKLAQAIEFTHVTNFEEIKIIELIGKIPEPTQSELYAKAYAKLDEAITQGSDDIAPTALYNARLLPTPLITKLIDKGFGHHSLLVQMEASSLIPLAEEGKRAEFVRKALGQSDVNIQARAARAISDVPLAERKSLMEQAMQDGMPGSTKEAAAPSIKSLAEEDRLVFIEQLLKEKARALRVDGVFSIELAPKSERARLFYIALQDTDQRVQSFTVSLIYKAPVEEHKNLLEFALAHTSGVAQENARHDLARYEQGTFNKVIISDEEIPDVPLPAEDSALFRSLQKDAEYTPLYNHHQERFGRKAFDKTGSGTTLLDTVPGNTDKSLRGKALIRHIDLTAYASWKQAYEADSVWKEKGFSYVPIEPIVGVRFSNNNEDAPWAVDVFTRVLGINAYAWLGESNGVYAKYITEQMDLIRATLKEMGVEHGHLHQRNFCLVFEKNKEDEPDISKPPRVYAIDFDRAVSSSKK